MTQIVKNLKPTLISKIEEAKNTIFISVAWFTDADLLETLTKKARSGCLVKIIISNDSKNFGESYSLNFEDFKNVGGVLHIYESAFLHHKYTIIDAETVIFGSANYTYNGFHKNKEVTTLSNDKELIEEFLSIFEALVEEFKVETELMASPLKNYLESEIKMLNVQIPWIETEIVEAEKHIEAYEVQYRIRFKDIIEEILFLKKLNAEKQDRLKNKPESFEAKNRATEAWNSFKENIEEDKSAKVNLENEDLQTTLKQVFREAVKLCHPDKVADEHKSKALKVFDAIKKAYNANNLSLMIQLLDDIKSGVAFDNIDFKGLSQDALQKIYDTLVERYATLNDQLQQLLSDKRLILQIDQNQVLNDHFDSLEIQMKEQLNVLRNR